MDLASVIFSIYIIVAMAVAVACAVIAGRRARSHGRRWLPWALLGLLFGVLALALLWRLDRHRGVPVPH